ncbi:MAG TPA: hypothetical protein VLW85_00845, partial [Myxococcales bacterium]|nr:hypothetical protein [Myxococcales bacterium]
MMFKKAWIISAAAAGIAAVSFAPVARAWKSYRAAQRKAQIAAAFAAVKKGADGIQWPHFDEDKGKSRRGEHDDPQLRRLSDLAYWGNRGPQFQARRNKIAMAEAKKWANLMPRTRGAKAPTGRSLVVDATGPTVFNLGPDRANLQWNSEFYNGNDSGRPTAVRVDLATDPT